MSADEPTSPTRRVGFANGNGLLHNDEQVDVRIDDYSAQAPNGSRQDETAHDGPDIVIDDAEGLDYDDNDTEMTSIVESDPAAFLEVDDDDDEGAESIFSPESIYAPSRYTAVTVPYRSDRMADNYTVNSSTRSIYEGDVDYVMEHGRRFCKEYHMPNDEEEQDRLRIVHQVYLNLFNLELTTVPLEDPRVILDVGTGTGEWAIGMSERFPNCEVIGMDISPIQSTSVPHNCNFEVDDAELEWERPDDSIDFVHFRTMAGAFQDWDFVYRQAYKCLKPGGWIELVDFHDHRGPKNFYHKFPPESIMHQFALDMEEAEKRSGRRRGVDHLDPQMLVNAGFVDTQVTEHAIPLDPTNSPLGKLWLVACRAGLEAGTLRPLTKYMGWAPERVREVCHIVGQQLISMALKPETSKGFDVRLRVLVARKPLVPGQWTAQNLTEYAEMREYSTEDDSTIGSGR